MAYMAHLGSIEVKMNGLRKVSSEEYQEFIARLDRSRLQIALNRQHPNGSHYADTIWDKTTGRPWNESIVARCIEELVEHTTSARPLQFLILDEAAR
jgi:hypothetical protein